MKEITIKNFNGMNLKEGLWEQSFSAYSSCIDFYGLGDDRNNLSYEGVLQGAASLTAMTQAANPNQVTSVMSDMTYYPTNATIYGVDANANARLYKLVSNTTWTLDRSLTGVSSSIIEYAGKIYYTNGTQLGQLNGGVYNDSFQTGLSGTNPSPMKVFAGSLFVGNGNNVSKYDGTTWTLQKLILPSNFTIRSMEVYREGLYISADNGAISRIFIWDGTSPTFNDSMLLETESFAPSLKSAAGYLWIVSNRGFPNVQGNDALPSFLSPIWIIQPGSQPDVLFELPLARSSILGTHIPMTGLTAYGNGILIGSGDKTTTLYEAGVGGGWYIGKDLATGLFHASLYFGIANSGVNGMTVGGMYNAGSYASLGVPSLLFGAKDSNQAYQVFQASPASSSANSFYNPVWESLPIDAGSTKQKSWVGIRFNFDPLKSGQSFRFFVKLDNPTVSWGSAVKTFSYDATQSTTSPYADRMCIIPINKTSRTIQIRVEFTPISSNVSTTRLHSFTLYYEPSGQ